MAQVHGMDAAFTVYRAVAETEGVKVTAAVLESAVAVLPDGPFDPAEATARIHAHLTGEQSSTALAEPEPNPAEVFIAEAQRLRTVVARTVHRPEFLSYAREHPDQARAVVAELRALLDDIEAAAGDPDAE